METMNKTREEVIEAFNLMWGNYSAPVMLITYGHEIAAVNDICASYGTPLGVKCSFLPGNHSGCRAAEAGRTGKPVREVALVKDRGIVFDGYWIPVEGEYLIHFGNDITEYADPEKFFMEES